MFTLGKHLLEIDFELGRFGLQNFVLRIQGLEVSRCILGIPFSLTCEMKPR